MLRQMILPSLKLSLVFLCSCRKTAKTPVPASDLLPPGLTLSGEKPISLEKYNKDRTNIVAKILRIPARPLHSTSMSLALGNAPAIPEYSAALK
jgi:hypothetical protein